MGGLCGTLEEFGEFWQDPAAHEPLLLTSGAWAWLEVQPSVTGVSPLFSAGLLGSLSGCFGGGNGMCWEGDDL